MKKRTLTILIAMVMYLVFGGIARAEIVTVEVTGVVDTVETLGDFALDGSVSIGTSMTGFCTYDSETPDLHENEGFGEYALISTSMGIGNYIFTHDSISETALFEVVNFAVIYSAKSGSASFNGTVFDDGTPKTYDDIIWHYNSFALLGLATSSHDYIVDDSLPDSSSFPPLSSFDIYKLFGIHFIEVSSGDGDFGISGEITSINVIPEPATVLFLALGSVLLLRRRKKRA